MSTEVILNTQIKTPAPPAEEKGCCDELCERIAAIWNRICCCICDLVSWLFTSADPNEFGVKEWKEYLQVDPGEAPPLPANIRETAAKLNGAYILTLIPATVNGQPLSFKTLAPLAEKCGLNLKVIDQIDEACKSETIKKSIWVWMQKDIEPNSERTKQVDAEKDYPGKLGKALWIATSATAHYARSKINLLYRYGLPPPPSTKGPWGPKKMTNKVKYENPNPRTRTSDCGTDKCGDWQLTVSSDGPDRIRVEDCDDKANMSYGVRITVPAENF